MQSDRLRERWEKQKRTDFEEISALSEERNMEMVPFVVEKAIVKCERFCKKYSGADSAESCLMGSQVHWFLGHMQMNTGHVEEAKNNLQESHRLARAGVMDANLLQLQELTHKELRAALCIAELSHKTKDYSAALRILVAGLGTARKQDFRALEGECLLWIGKTYMEQKKLSQTEAKLREAFPLLSPSSTSRGIAPVEVYAECHALLVSVLQEQGKNQEAEEIYTAFRKEILKTYQQSPEKLEKLLSSSKPRLKADLDFLNLRSMALDGRHELALLELQHWTQTQMPARGRDCFSVGMVFELMGVCHAKGEHHAEAEEAFTQAEVCYRNQPDPVKRAESLCTLKESIATNLPESELEAARRYFLEALAIRQKQNNVQQMAYCRFKLGERLAKAGQYEQALPLLQQSYRVLNKGGCYFLLANCFLELDRVTEAVETLLEQQNDGSDLWTRNSALLLAQLKFSMGIDTSGDEAWINAQETPTPSEAEQNELAELLASKRQELETAQRALRENGRQLLAQADALTAEGQHHDARIAFARALNRFRAVSDSHRRSSMQLCIGQCLLGRAEAWISLKEGDEAARLARLAAAQADCAEASGLLQSSGPPQSDAASPAARGPSEGGREWRELRVRQEALEQRLATLLSSPARGGASLRKAAKKGGAQAAQAKHREIRRLNGGAEACREGGRNDEECPCCLEEWRSVAAAVVMLACEHIVCGPCMLAWAQGRKQGLEADETHQAITHLNTTCPVCRGPVSGGLRSIQTALASSSGAVTASK